MILQDAAYWIGQMQLEKHIEVLQETHRSFPIEEGGIDSFIPRK
jgi:hypothetical protein